MIYVTGDTHGDLSRFKNPALRGVKKRDALIICGDFGFIWDGSRKEKRILKKLGKRRYDVLFVDGAHENFDELEKYGTEEWCGGLTRKISGRLRQLMRGRVYEIGGKKILAFGGEPGQADFDKAMEELEKVSFEVDYIVSYGPPAKITELLSARKEESDDVNCYADLINEKTGYKRWFFGKHHTNKIIPTKYFALFDNVISAEHTPTLKK